MAYFMYDFWRKNFVKIKNNCFKEIFDRLLYYGMNYNPHWNRNFEAASPQAPDCTSQFVTWFNLVNILWKGMNHTESALRGAAAKPPRSTYTEGIQYTLTRRLRRGAPEGTLSIVHRIFTWLNHVTNWDVQSEACGEAASKFLFQCGL